jgi:hypothetical protein
MSSSADHRGPASDPVPRTDDVDLRVTETQRHDKRKLFQYIGDYASDYFG